MHTIDPSAGYPRAFAQKLLASQRAARNIRPTKQHYDGYMYAPVDEVVAELKSCLNSFGLVLQTSVESIEEFETSTGKGKPQWMTTAHLRFLLSDSETGFTREYSFLGRGLNEKDKGVTHAIQSGKKLFLQSLLLVEVSDSAPSPPPHGPPPPPNRQQPRPSRRIPEASEIRFTRSEDGDFIRNDSGEVVRQCMSDEVHGRGEAPMIRVPPEGSRWLCILKECGHVEAHAPEEDEEDEDPPDGLDEEGQAYRAEAERKLKQHDVYSWQLDAIIEAHPELLPNMDAWGTERWKLLYEGLRHKPGQFIDAALKKCAEEIPADPQRIEYLRSLYPSDQVGFRERAEAEAAIKSGWHDAVEELIQRWEGKVEATELPLTAGEGAE